MIVMPANNRGQVAKDLAHRFPGRVAHLYSPGGLSRLYECFEFALDNGRFAMWAAGKQWDEAAYIGMLDGHPPQSRPLSSAPPAARRSR